MVKEDIFIDPRDCVIYAIRNKTNLKCYVGSTVRKDRYRGHKGYLKKGTHHSPKLQNAWNKYGEDAFEFIILQELGSVSKKVRLLSEDYWVGALGHYNNRPVTEDWSRFSASQDSIIKVTKTSQEWRKNNPQEGTRNSERNSLIWNDPIKREKRTRQIRDSMTLERCQTRKKNTLVQWQDLNIAKKQKIALKEAWKFRRIQNQLDVMIKITPEEKKKRGKLANSSRVPFVKKRLSKNLSALAQSKAMLEACIKSIETSGTL